MALLAIFRKAGYSFLALTLAVLASFFSASSLLIFIPYQSTAFAALSIALFGVSLYVLNKKLGAVGAYV